MADYFTKIVTTTDETPKVTGGAWGAKASVPYRGQTVEARGADKAAALMGLWAKIENLLPTPAERDLPDFAPKKPSVVVHGLPDVPEAAPDAPVAPKAPGGGWKGTGKPRACDVSCVFAHKDRCVCQCEGANHLSGWLLFGGEDTDPFKEWGGPDRVKGGRSCLCGCGQMTKGGRFLQGHDRKMHAALADVVEGSGFFKEEDGVGLVLTPLGRKTLKAAR